MIGTKERGLRVSLTVFKKVQRYINEKLGGEVVEMVNTTMQLQQNSAS